MSEMIAFCGLDCLQCGALLATRENDDAKRREVAELWSKEFDADIQSQDINCDGCTSEGGILFGHCEVCEIRKCGKEKAIANCAYCAEFVCDKLESFFSIAPEAKLRLDKISSRM
jgi:hypothetical protein